MYYESYIPSTYLVIAATKIYLVCRRKAYFIIHYFNRMFSEIINSTDINYNIQCAMTFTNRLFNYPIY